MTSWAEKGITPDLNSGRWVMKGEATKSNYIRTGLIGPKSSNKFPFIKNSNVPFNNLITSEMPANKVVWPKGLNKWRGIFGQRQIK